jgi:glutathione S-transferase
MMLSHAGTNWDESEYTFDEWPKHKASMPNGQMPCLQLKDGTKMGESYAIGRYLGALHGYYPSDPRLAYEVDYLLEGYESCFSKVPGPFFAKNNEEREE